MENEHKKLSDVELLEKAVELSRGMLRSNAEILETLDIQDVQDKVFVSVLSMLRGAFSIAKVANMPRELFIALTQLAEQNPDELKKLIQAQEEKPKIIFH